MKRSAPTRTDATLRTAERVRDWRRRATGLLADVSDTAALDADVLLAHVLGRPRAWLMAHGEEPLTGAASESLARLLGRRLDREPMAYLTGTREFWSLEFDVTPATLVPRPETELLVELALARTPPDADVRIAELGTGSGAIAVALAVERPRAHIIATDVSADALAVARANAARHGARNVDFIESDWWSALAGCQFDLVISNPPYVAAGDPGFAGELRHEPRSALASGDDGLDDIRRIAAGLDAALTGRGMACIEHGHMQADAVAGILCGCGFTATRTHRDLAGLARVTEARRADR
jgi:release factor glutamine methyltransferase